MSSLFRVNLSGDSEFTSLNRCPPGFLNFPSTPFLSWGKPRRLYLYCKAVENFWEWLRAQKGCPGPGVSPFPSLLMPLPCLELPFCLQTALLVDFTQFSWSGIQISDAYLERAWGSQLVTTPHCHRLPRKMLWDPKSFKDSPGLSPYCYYKLNLANGRREGNKSQEEVH